LLVFAFTAALTAQVETIGPIETEFSLQGRFTNADINDSNDLLRNTAYMIIYTEAISKHEGNIDVVNIKFALKNRIRPKTIFSVSGDVVKLPEGQHAEILRLTKPLNAGENVIGSVNKSFRQNGDIADASINFDDSLFNRAYMELFKEASAQHRGNIDIRDIKIEVRDRLKDPDQMDIMASGKVVRLD
jgi:pimeloyl-CoA synthetase